jgi:hypothetical protein
MAVDPSELASGQGAAGLPGDASSGTEAANDTSAAEITAGESTGAPEAIASSEDSQDSLPEGADTDDEAAASARAAAEDQADLEQYPEAVRERFKALDRAERKALYEHAEQNAKRLIESANERAARAEAARREADERAKAVRETQGKFTGITPIELVDQDGKPYDGPTYDELTTLLGTRRGRDELETRYGLSEGTAEAVKAELDTRRGMLDSAAGHFDEQSLLKRAQELHDGLQGINGVDPDACVDGVTPQNGGLREVLRRAVAQLEVRHTREMDAQKRDYEARLTNHALNAEGMRGRVAAAEGRRLPTGGRTGAGAVTQSAELARLAKENPDEYIRRAIAGEFANIDLTK